MSDATTTDSVPRWRREAANFLEGRRLPLLLPAIGALLLLLLPTYLDDLYWMREVSLILVLTLVVSGVNLSFGYAGEVQFGQVFILALSAYVTMALAVHGFDEIVPLLLIGAVVAFLAGVIIALPALRIGGWSLAMASFFLVITLPNLVAIAHRWTGGLDGLFGIPAPKLFGHTLGTEGLYWTTAIVAVIWMLLYRNLVTSRYGVAFRVLRHSPTLSESLGFSTMSLKTLAYSLGAVPAGLAGCLFGYLSLVITPSSFSLDLAIGVLAASVLGGVESVYGALLGAALLQKGPEESLSFAQYAPVAYGLFLVLAAALLRGGIGTLSTQVLHRVARRLAPVALRHVPDDDATRAERAQSWVDRGAGPALTARLEVTGVSKTYGGVNALREVSLRAEPGQITALIGSNGSGKTTLLNVICGYANASHGSVRLGADTLTGRSPARVARLGVGRTFQTPAVPTGVSVLDAVAAGGFRAERCGIVASVLRLPRYHRARRATLARAHRYLRVVGLEHLANEDASSLALGTQRLVEVARALCADPTLLLLDEPASGLSSEEVDRLGGIIRLAAKAGTTVVLIEHNFGFVAAISDTVHVLHLGQLIASGTATEVGRDERVVESYLGGSTSVIDGDRRRPAGRPVRRASGELAATEPALVLRGAVSGYGDLKVIDGVDLDLRPGQVEVVLGRNGVGKTTLLATIAGQVRLWDGTLTLAGAPVRRKAYRRAGAGIALVQEGKRIFRQRTVWQNLLVGTHSLRVRSSERVAICRHLVEHFPMLEQRLHDRAGALSGGQQQMLAIAQALAARPRVLLLDEPSAGLAPAIIDDLFERIGKLADDGLAVLLVEQLAERALGVADHVTVIDRGKVVADGPPERFADTGSLRQVYFGASSTEFDLDVEGVSVESSAL